MSPRASRLAVLVAACALMVGVAGPAGAQEDVFDIDHPCDVFASPPSQTAKMASSLGSYDCPNPHRGMTVVVWIEVLTVNGGGYHTVATETYSMGSTPSNTVFGPVTGDVCPATAVAAKARATGWWVDSNGNKRGTRSHEGLPVPLNCLERTDP